MDAEGAGFQSGTVHGHLSGTPGAAWSRGGEITVNATSVSVIGLMEVSKK